MGLPHVWPSRDGRGAHVGLAGRSARGSRQPLPRQRDQAGQSAAAVILRITFATGPTRAGSPRPLTIPGDGQSILTHTLTRASASASTGPKLRGDQGKLLPTASHHQFLTDRSQEFGNDRCFICGRHIPEGSPLRTVEHVFPKWLLRELDLWNGTVHQLNDELLQYRQLTVPCCLTCNGQDLSAIEARVKAAFQEGFDAFCALDRRDLFIWLGKIYYGLIYKENLRPRFVREQDGERIVPDSHLQSVAFHHFLLQSAGGFVSWEPAIPGPASFHFFECLDDDRSRRRFDYMDDLFAPIIGLRIGSIGVVCVLQDWGRSEGVQQLQLNAARQMKLHPTQFREVYARLSYMTKVSWRNMRHPIIGGDNKAVVIAGDPGDFAGSFNVADYAQTLSHIWAVPLEAVYRDGFTFSTICDQVGTPNVAISHDVVFTAPHGITGLWPAHEVLTDQLQDGPPVGS
jgi:hypothetical protein